MAASETFLAACRTAIAAAPELSAFRAAYAAYDAAARSAKPPLWYAAYGGNADECLAQRLRNAVRGVVAAKAEAGGVTAIDREAAVRALTAEYVPVADRPANAPAEAKALQDLISEDHLS